MCTLGVSVTGVGGSSSFSEFTHYIPLFFPYNRQPLPSNLYLLLPADLIRTKKKEID